MAFANFATLSASSKEKPPTSTHFTLFTVKTSSYMVKGAFLPHKLNPHAERKRLFSGRNLAAQMQMRLLGGVAWQKDDLAGAMGGGGGLAQILKSLNFTEWGLQRLLSARLMQVRGIQLNFRTLSNTAHLCTLRSLFLLSSVPGSEIVLIWAFMMMPFKYISRSAPQFPVIT